MLRFPKRLSHLSNHSMVDDKILSKFCQAWPFSIIHNQTYISLWREARRNPMRKCRLLLNKVIVYGHVQRNIRLVLNVGKHQRLSL